MKKFTEINEEFLGMWKKTESPEFFKTHPGLIEMYVKNLVSEEFIEISSKEEEIYDFKYYKVISISKPEVGKFIVTMSVYDKLREKVGEKTFHLTIK
jgi:hypothetical protein